MFTRLYRKYIPISLRLRIYNTFLSKILFFIRNFEVLARSKFNYWFKSLLRKTERNQAYSFMGKYGLTSYPYEYMLEYKNRSIEVEFDPASGLPYVIHNNRKLYFPASFTSDKISKDYRSLLIEQDIRSSHRYVRSYDELKGKTLLDIGSAEGIFALDTIDLTKQVYLFECENTWLAPLEQTFAPWKEKVTIVKKYVSDTVDKTNITLDNFLADKSENNLFIKMDIEGAEQLAILGAIKTLKSDKKLQLSICTYHRKSDAEEIGNFFSSIGYSFEFTKGFMYWQKRLSKGVIRCHN